MVAKRRLFELFEKLYGKSDTDFMRRPAFFLENTMILGREQGNTRSIRREDLFS